MFPRRLPLFRLLGFQVWIDWSWFILALLITWSLATGLFPRLYKDASLHYPTLWIMGAVGAIGLFTSIVLHELGHSVIARRFGMRMRGITLFIFGGVAEMTDEPPSAKAEFFVAIAGPIVSIVIGVGMLGLALAATVLHWPIAIMGVTAWLGWINLVLVGFNMIPAFPLDGGRVLRAALWHWKQDLRWATRITSSIGNMFGVGLIVLGVISFIGGNFVGGIWWVILGLFLRGAAASSYQQLVIRRALEGEPVSRFMSHSPIAVPSDISISQLVEDYFYRHYHQMYPVTDNGQVHGCVTISDIKAIPREQWPARTVRDIAGPCSEANTVRPTEDAMQALSKMNRTGVSRLLVIDDGRLVGILSLKDMLRFLSVKTDLEK